MHKTSPSLPDSYAGLSGSFFIDTSSLGRTGYPAVTVDLEFCNWFGFYMLEYWDICIFEFLAWYPSFFISGNESCAFTHVL